MDLINARNMSVAGTHPARQLLLQNILILQKSALKGKESKSNFFPHFDVITSKLRLLVFAIKAETFPRVSVKL